MRYRVVFSILFFISVLTSCFKKDVEPCPDVQLSEQGKMLILNEGLFQQNNSTLTRSNYLDGGSTPNFFQQIASRPLGDVGNDIKRYGNKIYIVMNTSSRIEVIDATTFEVLQPIEMFVGNTPKQPRFIDFYNGKAFVTCYDGFVDVLDTTTLTITNRIGVGSNPDHLRVAGNKVYVSNSGGLNFPNVDSTLSVIDLNTEIETSKITVGKNPGSIVLGGNGDIYVVSRGDFGAVPSRMHRISSSTDTKIQSYPFDASQLTEKEGDIIVFSNVTQASSRLFDVNTNDISTAELIDFNGIQTPYKVEYSPLSQNIFVFDANGYVNEGFVIQYSSNGGYIRKIEAGLVPTQVLLF